MSARQRFILEGEWTGYVARQRRVVHREVLTGALAEAAKKLHAIVYTDGTSLLLHVREAKPREKVQQINGYTSLIRDALKTGRSHVLVSEMEAGRP